MSSLKGNSAKWPVVITVHGIRTTGRWQKELSEVLLDAKFRHMPLDFGFFLALTLLIPWSRAKKIEWFHQVYSEKFGDSERRPSIIAHSFGSYIVTMAMLKYADIRFDRIILCGSIVSRNYPWTDIALHRKQVNAVLNEAGRLDFWAGLVEWLVVDAGASGVSGFDDMAGGAVTQIVHPEHRHSDYFYLQNYVQRWLPFLRGIFPDKVMPARIKGVNWRFFFTRSLLFSALIFTAWFVLMWSKSDEIARQSLATENPNNLPVRSDYGHAADGPGYASSGNEPAIISSLKENETLGSMEEKSRMGEVIGSADAEIAGKKVLTENQGKIAENTSIVFSYFRGSWFYEGPLPVTYTPVPGGRCQHVGTRQVSIDFDHADEVTGSIPGNWKESQKTRTRFEQDDQLSRARIQDGINACVGASVRSLQSYHTLVRNGEFTVHVGEDVDWNDFQTELNILDCKMDGSSCETDGFGRQSIEKTEKIENMTMKGAGLIFAKR